MKKPVCLVRILQLFNIGHPLTHPSPTDSLPNAMYQLFTNAHCPNLGVFLMRHEVGMHMYSALTHNIHEMTLNIALTQDPKNRKTHTHSYMSQLQV